MFDTFKGHLTEVVSGCLQKKNSNLAVIPGGMTSQSQPLDVSVNKPFKEYLQEEYEKWMSSENFPRTNTRKIKKAPASIVAD